MKKCLLVYNPISGGAKKLFQKLPYIRKKLEEKYEVVDEKPTSYAGEAIEIARAACGEYEAIIACGGDGTVSEVIRGIGEQKNAPVLGYIPAGSCGDFANNHKIPHSIKGALKVILRGNKKDVDLCKVNDTYFSYILGVGTYTGAIAKTDPKLKKFFRKGAYYISGIMESFHVKTYHITVTVGRKVYHIDDAVIVLVLNSKSIAGFKKINYMAQMDDGKIDVIVVRKNEFNTPINIWKLFLQGVESFKDNRLAFYTSAKKCKIDVAEKTVWNMDGDPIGFQNLEIECLNKKLKVFSGE